MGITATGFLAGLANYGIGQKIITDNPAWGTVLDRSHKFSGGIGVSYLDYIANHQIIYGDYYGSPTEYYGYGNKMGIGSVKNTFIHLIISP
ncbi:MAG: hypothetical protein JJT77_11315 [Crocinitomicaceae bacterium]|nr:hypothetical protein [Crocinitomicaceae bacterium]